MAVLRPFLYLANRKLATRVVHSILRGISRDRLDLLGEEYFQYQLKPRLKQEGVRRLKEAIDSGAEVVLVSQGLDFVMRPLAQHLGAKWMVANRLDFRDGIATGRLLEPVIRPRRIFARVASAGPEGSCSLQKLVRDLGVSAQVIESAIVPAERTVPKTEQSLVYFEGQLQDSPISIRAAFHGKHILLIGVTGFIGKVWLANTLMDLPEVGCIYLLIRRQKSNPAERRFEKLVGESPVFDPLYERYGQRLSKFLDQRVRVIEGDVTQTDLGMTPE